MRVIVCGGREFANYTLMWDVLNRECPPGSTIVHGAARGADYLAGFVARSLGLNVEEHPADWTWLGRSAGPRRNEQMAASGADLCIAFPGGRGTADMVRRAKAHGILVYHVTDPEAAP